MLRTRLAGRALTTLVQAGDDVKGVGAVRTERWLHGSLGAVRVGRTLERHAAVSDAVVAGRTRETGVCGSCWLVGACHTADDHVICHIHHIQKTELRAFFLHW